MHVVDEGVGLVPCHRPRGDLFLHVSLELGLMLLRGAAEALRRAEHRGDGVELDLRRIARHPLRQAQLGPQLHQDRLQRLLRALVERGGVNNLELPLGPLLQLPRRRLEQRLPRRLGADAGCDGSARARARAQLPAAVAVVDVANAVVIAAFLDEADVGVGRVRALGIEPVQGHMRRRCEALDPNLGAARHQHLLQASLCLLVLALAHQPRHFVVSGRRHCVGAAQLPFQPLNVLLGDAPQHVEVSPELVELEEVGGPGDVGPVLAVEELDDRAIRVPH
mmetsp:Transcript_30635/g.88419  ORF Transcript_30635/g.88419 Transcript_30635/m.88419 type:complete len:279 (-) Transcript_30635:3131-3967(-)